MNARGWPAQAHAVPVSRKPSHQTRVAMFRIGIAAGYLRGPRLLVTAKTPP